MWRFCLEGSGLSDLLHGKFPLKTFVFWIVGALVLVIAGIAAGVFLVQRPGADSLTLQLRTQQAAEGQARSALDAQLAAAHAQTEQLRQVLTIERAARTTLEKNLTELQQQLGYTQDHLAFYEQLLPAGAQGAITLRAVELERQDQTLKFKVLLMRGGKPGERFNGRLQFAATGLRDGQEVTLLLHSQTKGADPSEVRAPLNTVGAAAQEQESLALSFDSFQRSQGVLALPPDFQPSTVVVSILAGDIVLASSKVDL